MNPQQTDTNLKPKSLPVFDQRYPGHSFMQVSNINDGTATMVVTRKDIQGKPLYVEGDIIGSVDHVAAAMVVQIGQMYERSRLLNGGKNGMIKRFTPSGMAGVLNRVQQRIQDKIDNEHKRWTAAKRKSRKLLKARRGK